MKIAVIGSGLAAVSAARALVARGLKPVILDYGMTMESERYSLASEMSKVSPQEWTQKQKNQLFENTTVNNTSTVPQKLAFGSGYFYGDSLPEAEIRHDGLVPPLSYARGGYSIGWGASVLPPSDCDLSGWPIQMAQLHKSFEQVLTGLPYSAKQDGLAKQFPVYSTNTTALRLTTGNRQMLQSMDKAFRNADSNELAYGQSRLLTRSAPAQNLKDCQYCGQCMSGCVYDCIYKANQSLDHLIKNQQVEYRSGILVTELTEIGNQVEVSVQEIGIGPKTLNFDRVFLAAGALNSTRIILKSKKLYNQKVILRSTSGFVLPLFRFRRMKRDWPVANTQPGLFFEYKAKELSEHWIHVQLSTPNELVYEMLGIHKDQKGLLPSLKKRASEHLAVALCGLHSDHSNGYEIQLKLEDGKSVLHSEREDRPDPYIAHKIAKKKFASLARKFGCYAISAKAQHSIRGGGYHVGGSLPMRGNPTGPLETNLIGNPTGWKRIHVVDSSVFPSLPGTTIGLLAMANATRVCSEVNFES